MASIGVNIRFRTFGKLFNLARLRSSTKVLEELIHGTPYSDPEVKIGGTLLKTVTSFCYLGSTKITENMTSHLIIRSLTGSVIQLLFRKIV